jgi:histidinol phosphatase-like enzyme (inositol monophosphatase family)
METEKFMELALELADESRRIIRAALEKPQVFENKDDQSPVTQVDKLVEDSLRNIIAERYPSHGFLGEETLASQLDSEYVWVIDPIDGTKAFITGLPVFGTLIALARHGRPFLGVMEFPATFDRWVGLDGQVSSHNGQPCRTRESKPFVKANQNNQNNLKNIMAISNPEALNLDEKIAFSKLRAEMQWAVYGGSSYLYGRLAQGRLDIIVDAGLDPFDYCALEVVIRGAGGVMTDWEGKPLTIRSGTRVVASGDLKLHQLAIDILGNTPK